MINLNISPTFCCLPIKKALIVLLYLDMSRIVWGLLICAFLFQSGSSLSLVTTIVDIICIVLQSSVALYVSMRAVQNNDLKALQLYRKIKLAFIISNALDRLVTPIFNCTLIFQQDHDDLLEQYCAQDLFVALVITAILWTFIEYYFYILARTYCLTLTHNNYRPVQHRQHIQAPIKTQAVVYEVRGIKPATRRGQLVYNQDNTAHGSITNFSYMRWFESNKLKPYQNFQVLGRAQEFETINLRN